MAIILKPRITIYAFNDTTYATQLYTYNAFTDSGATTKPVSMQFESTTTGAGSFSIEIEDSDGLLDQETFIKGNRIFIECSKDGSTWQPAFKGLIRSVKRSLFGALGSTFTISGYSYLVRFNERILNTIRESSVTGGQYNRTDSTMFTNNLINSILTTDSNYVYGLDDTQQYSVFKTSNIASSPITTWIPRLDAQLTTISEAISSILEFSSNALMVMDPSNDQLVLFDPQQIASGANVFLVTDQPNFTADDAAITMYPIEPYTYDISYDYPDSGSRLIASIGNPPEVTPCPEQTVTTGNTLTQWEAGFEFVLWVSGVGNVWYGTVISIPGDSPVTSVSIGMKTMGAPTGTDRNRLTAQLGEWITSGSPANVIWAATFGSQFDLYLNGDSSATLPTAASGVLTAPYIMKTVPSFSQTLNGWPPTITSNGSTNLGLRVSPYNTTVQDANNSYHWGRQFPYDSPWQRWVTATGAITGNNPGAGSATQALKADLTAGAASVTIPPCADPVASLKDADDVFAVAEDKNMSKRLGMVERVVSDIPTHVRTAQTMNEYLFARLFTASKPRFTFDFPAVSIPTKIPKAGDIVAHVSKKAGVGTKSSPLQTGVIMSVNYEFRQDDEGIIGLTKLGLSTTGIRRGYY
jgi:hypothetical protein